MKNLVILILLLSPAGISQEETSFPLDIGNKWFYQNVSNRDECYGIIKEVTDTLSNGFREITSTYLYRTSISSKKEYWGFLDGKFYSNTTPQIQNANVLYNYYLTHDSCFNLYHWL